MVVRISGRDLKMKHVRRYSSIDCVAREPSGKREAIWHSWRSYPLVAAHDWVAIGRMSLVSKKEELPKGKGNARRAKML